MTGDEDAKSYASAWRCAWMHAVPEAESKVLHKGFMHPVHAQDRSVASAFGSVEVAPLSTSDTKVIRWIPPSQT